MFLMKLTLATKQRITANAVILYISIWPISHLLKTCECTSASVHQTISLVSSYILGGENLVILLTNFTSLQSSSAHEQEDEFFYQCRRQKTLKLYQRRRKNWRRYLQYIGVLVGRLSRMLPQKGIPMQCKPPKVPRMSPNICVYICSYISTHYLFYKCQQEKTENTTLKTTFPFTFAS